MRSATAPRPSPWWARHRADARRSWKDMKPAELIRDRRGKVFGHGRQGPRGLIPSRSPTKRAGLRVRPFHVGACTPDLTAPRTGATARKDIR